MQRTLVLCTLAAAHLVMISQNQKLDSAKQRATLHDTTRESFVPCACSKMQSTNVEAWTSTVEADIFQNGQILSKRMDVLLGSSLGSCKGESVCLTSSQ